MNAEQPELKPMFRPDESTVRVGFPTTPLTDLYYNLLRGSWTLVLVVFMLVYLAINCVFALLYLAGGDCINGAEPGSFEDAFFFSVQTLATIGYGALTPKTTFANLVVTVEAMVGLIGTALATGIVFAKFARPRANVRFTTHALIAPYDGKLSLYFRVANVRGNDVVEATVRIAALVNHTTSEGHGLRRLQDLAVVRASSPLFRLSWLVVHVIDEHSPLHGKTLADLHRDRTMLVVSLMGMDGTFAQAVHARHVYLPQDILFDHHFDDIIEDLPDGRIRFDFNKFHGVHPLTHGHAHGPDQGHKRGANRAGGAGTEADDDDDDEDDEDDDDRRENSELIEAELEDARAIQDNPGVNG